MGPREIVSEADRQVRFARSGIDTPLKVSSVFGIISGVLFLSSFAALNQKLGPVDLSSPPTFVSLIIASAYGLLVILGSLVVLFAQMNIERRGVLAFFVFIASVLAIVGSLFFLSFIFGGPQ